MLASPAVQDYLKAIYRIAEDNAPVRQVSTKAVADHLGVSAPSATSMLKRLDEMGLVRHTSYRGATLTRAGTRLALEVIRHHRLLETYLHRVLGLPWDVVHEEAEILEHVLSDRLEDRIAAALGEPVADPHGHPIPTKAGAMPAASRMRLWDSPNGATVVVESVSDRRPEVLRYLDDQGIRPGTRVDVVRRGPVDGPLTVRVAGATTEVALSQALAEAIRAGAAPAVVRTRR